MIDLSSLNEQQHAAVTHGEGPLLVIAAAGSGKTRVLTYRAAYLIDQGVEPWSILLATFTRKAAREMVERVARLAGDAASAVRSGTIHSLFLRVLRAEQYPWPDFEIADEVKQKRLLRDLLKRERGSDSDLAELVARISLWKNELITPEQAVQEDQDAGLSYFGYEQAKKEANLLDFDDMLVLAVRLFEERPEVLERERSRTPWILVDEAQDTSTAQWRLLEMLAGVDEGPVGKRDPNRNESAAPTPADPSVVGDGAPQRPKAVVAGAHAPQAVPGNLGVGDVPELRPTGGDADSVNRHATGPTPGIPGNLTAVADWRQAIYSWRGARPGYVLDFERKFPGAITVGLPTNYRSTPEIVGHANILIRHSGQVLEDMVPVRSAGVKPLQVFSESHDVEAEWVVGEIQSRIADGASPENFAILYRVNSYSRAFEDALAKAAIPYVVIGSQGFFGRREVTDVVAYLRFMVDPTDEESFRRIVNRPTRYLGRAYCDAVAKRARENNRALRESLVPPELNARQRENARRFKEDLDRLEDMLSPGGSPVPGIRHIRGRMGYDRWLLREEGSGTVDEDRIGNLDELVDVAAKYSLEKFIGYVDVQRARSKSDDPKGRVQLLSIHRSKGLEWPVVFAVGISDGILPHARAESNDEERRLMYVAITRARDELFVSSVREWQNRILDPSPFVYEAGLVDPEKYAAALALREEAAV